MNWVNGTTYMLQHILNIDIQTWYMRSQTYTGQQLHIHMI